MSRFRMLAIGALVAGIILGGSLVARSSDAKDEVEFAGMTMTRGALQAMTESSMGTERLDDVKLVTPQDREATLPHRVIDGIKVFELEARPLRWEYRDGQTVAAWGYEQQVPGPAIRATEGDKIRVIVNNALTEPTTVHWHGVDVPFEQDGVPGVTQEAIPPGKEHTYEFTATPAGTRFYHTHGSTMGDEARQLDMGLSGALIIDPKPASEAANVDETFILDEWAVEKDGLNAAMMSGAGHAAHNAGFNVYTINGRAAPDFQPITVKRGQTMRLRFINAGSSATHPMHLHGHQFTVTALDGNPVPPAARQRRNVITLAPGETADVTLRADNPGVWMLHCHELHHADAGMMTLLQYEGVEPIGDHDPSRGDEH